MLEGSWDKDDIRRVFVAGAKWWEWESRDATMWGSDVRKAEAEATRRYATQPGNAADTKSRAAD